MAPKLIPSSARITTQTLVSAKSNGRKDLVQESCVYDVILPSKQLPTQSQQLKTKNKV